MADITFKRGDTLSIDCQYQVDSVNAPLPPTMASQVRNPSTHALVDTFTITNTNASAGQFNLSATAAQTGAWPLALLNYDVEYTEADGTVHSSPTETIQVEMDVTHTP